MIAISEMGRRGGAGFPGWRDEGQLNWRHIEFEMPLRHPGRHGQEGAGHRANFLREEWPSLGSIVTVKH